MKKIMFILLFLFAFVQSGFCEITNEIRYNGRLKGYTVPLGGGVIRQLKFEYFDSANTGKSLGIESYNVTPSSDGVFSVTLKPNIQWNTYGKVWIEVSIDGRIMKPREQIMAQPLALHANNGVPPGTVIAFAGEKVPIGYLLCDGREVNTSDYPELFEAIGSLYGTASGGKFKLPNFQGVFLRGNGSQYVNYGTYGNTTHSSLGLGTVQGDAIRNIKGGFASLRINNPPSFWSFNLGAFKEESTSNAENANVGNSRNQPNYHSFDASRVVPTSNENRPANYAINYCIKY